MLKKISSKLVGPAPWFLLELAPRLNILTGDNGLGKTFILDIAWWTLTHSWAGAPALPQPSERLSPPRIDWKLSPSGVGLSVYNPELQEWGYELLQTPKRSVVLYARVDGSFSVWDAARGAKIPQGYHFSPDTLWNGFSNGDRVLSNGLIRDWVSWQHQGTEAFAQLVAVLKALSPGESEVLRPGPPIRVRLDDVREIPTLAMPYGTVPLTYASAGVKRIVGLAYLLVWAWQEHLQASQLLRWPPAAEVVFLVDELEAHLHPRWQRLLLPALISVMKELKSSARVQLLATTHAPLVLASVEPLFDTAQDALFTLDLEGREVRVTRAEWRERGDASAWLTSEVFDLKEARSLPAEQAIERAMAAFRRPDLPIDEVKKIHHDLHTVLKDTDPFWPRWLVRARAAGIEP